MMFLNENQNKIKINSLFLSEGLFSSYSIGYYVCEGKQLKISKNEYHKIYKNIEYPLRNIIGDKCNGRLKEWGKYQSNFNDYNTPVIIDKKFKEKLNNLKITLFKVKIKGKFESDSEIKYGKTCRDNIEIINIEFDSANNLIKKYNISIKFEDKLSSINTSERNKVLSSSIKEFKEELSSIKSKYPEIKNSIEICKIENDEKEKFINGELKEISIGRYDLFKFSKNPRDIEEQNKFWLISKEFERNINSRLSKFKCEFKNDGDWDDGFYYLIIDN